MDVTYNEALKYYSALPEKIKFPGAHPTYSLIDGSRDSQIAPTFFVYTAHEHTFYHSFHLRKIENLGVCDIESPYGYAGPLSSTTDETFINEANKAYYDWCVQRDILVEFIRFHPVIKNDVFYTGTKRAIRKTIEIDLSLNLFESYASRGRYEIKRAERDGVIVYESNNAKHLDVFVQMYIETMQRVGADSYYFFPKYYFKKMFEWEKSTLIVSENSEHEIIAASFFLSDGEICEYHLSGAKKIVNSSGGVRSIINLSAKNAKINGATSLHLGGGTDSSPDDSLLFFKKSFSKKEQAFCIGTRIFQTDRYEDLKNKLTNLLHPERIIFYR